MMEARQPAIQSVSELLTHLEAVELPESGNAGRPPRLWFRGQGDSGWPLVPAVGRDSFHRRAAWYDGLYGPDAWRHFERYVFHAFRTFGNHLLPPGTGIVEEYFLARHHGLPTRLLDWTLQPLVALFFAAFEGAERDGAVYYFGTDEGFHIDRFHQDDDSIRHALEEFLTTGRDTLNRIVGIEPSAQQVRVNQQFSCFTFHDDSDFGETRPFPVAGEDIGADALRVPARAKGQLLKELRLLGITRATLFPDLTGVVDGILDEYPVPPRTTE